MPSTQYLALLRGINVGGRNIIPMADLRAAFDAAGYGEVRTYIQTGNVLFDSSEPNANLERLIESALEQQFGIALTVVVRSRRQLRQIVHKAPADFGRHPELHHSDVIFLKSPLSARQALAVLKPRHGVDAAWRGTRVLYVARLSARRTETRLTRITSAPEYQQMTIRSWATTTKLLALLDEGRG